MYDEHHGDEPAIKKIYSHEKLSETDIHRQQEIFWTELGTREEYDEQAQSILYGDSVAAFIRSIRALTKTKHCRCTAN